MATPIVSYPYNFARWLALHLRRGRPARVFYFNGGIGDQLLCGCVARELARRGVGPIWFLTQSPELFAEIPGVKVATHFSTRLLPWLRLSGTPVEVLWYAEQLPTRDGDIPAREHIIAALCRKARITGRVELRPYLPAISPEPRPRRSRPQIAVQSSCLSARYPILNKQWPAERMQGVVSALGREIDFVQLGCPADPLLDGAKDLRGKTDTLGAAKILTGCDLFLGLPGFLMHLARAVDCPAVIVYGGHSTAETSGYSCNTNLANQPPCSPCWANARCDYERKCLTAIGVDDVVAAVRETLAVPPARPLRAQWAEIIPNELAVATG